MDLESDTHTPIAHKFVDNEETGIRECETCGTNELDADKHCKPRANVKPLPTRAQPIHVDRQRAVNLEQLRQEVLAERKQTILDDIDAYKKFKGSAISTHEHALIKNLVAFIQRRHTQLAHNQERKQKASA